MRSYLRHKQEFLRLNKRVEVTQIIKLFIARAPHSFHFYHRLMEVHNF